MNLNIATKMEGFYNLKVHGGKRGEIDFGTHKNMILDAGITYMLNNKYPFEFIHVGSGSSQPNSNQVQLDTGFALTNRNKKITHGYVSADDSENGKAYGYSRLEVQFDRGAAKGNISEIGVGNNTDGNPLWSRSLILDKSGNPTSITILKDEYLTVTYEARRYVNTETVTTTLQYDDDGEVKSVECSVVPSKNTQLNGYGSAGLKLSFINTTQLLNPTGSRIENNFNVANNALTCFFKYNTSQANNINISSPTIRAETGIDGIIPTETELKFNPPLRKTNEFEITIGVTVTIERA